MPSVPNKRLFVYKKSKLKLKPRNSHHQIWACLQRIFNFFTSIPCLFLYCLVIIVVFCFHILIPYLQSPFPEAITVPPPYRPNFLQNPIPSNCEGILCGIYVTSTSSFLTSNSSLNEINGPSTTIIVITPTNKRLERLPDLTRFVQTLMHIKNIHWIVIEDGIEIMDAVNRLLKRSKIPYAYFFASKEPGLPVKGWAQRNDALTYLRKYYQNFDGNAVVYFGDDDNTYDIRLFNNFIRNVKKVGVWPVGIVGGAVVEGPIVKDNKVINWQAIYKPNRTFAIDMAGFAVNLDLILSTNAKFGYQCIQEAPEDCFLSQLGIQVNDLEPFGYKNNNYTDILAFHTKTVKSDVVNNNNDSNFVMETNK